MAVVACGPRRGGDGKHPAWARIPGGPRANAWARLAASRPHARPHARV